MGKVTKDEMKEIRKQMLPLVTTFSPRDSLSKLSSPLGLPKEFAKMEQRLQEMHPKDEDRMFYYHSSEINPCILLVVVLCKSGKAER